MWPCIGHVPLSCTHAIASRELTRVCQKCCFRYTLAEERQASSSGSTTGDETAARFCQESQTADCVAMAWYKRTQSCADHSGMHVSQRYIANLSDLPPASYCCSADHRVHTFLNKAQLDSSKHSYKAASGSLLLRSSCHERCCFQVSRPCIRSRRSPARKVTTLLRKLFPVARESISTDELQLCVRNCEPHSYHERPHTYSLNPPTPGLRVALATDPAAKANQGQLPDHPKALDAL